MKPRKPRPRIKLIKKAERRFERKPTPPGWRQLARDVGPDISATFGGGVAEYKTCRFEWTLLYDEYLFGLSGRLTIRVGRKAYHIDPGDGLWLPANTKIVYECKKRARALYMVYPIDWKRNHDMK